MANRNSEVWFEALRRCINETLAQPHMKPSIGICECLNPHNTNQLYRCTCGLRLDAKCFPNHVIEIYKKTGTIHYIMNNYP